RMHDPRVGRFFAVDPLTAKYPHYTPYSFSGNKVIAFIELEGLEEFNIRTNKDWNFRRFRIRKGDNLSIIAKSTNVQLSDILKWNPQIKDKDLIYPYEIINLVDARNLDPSDLFIPINNKSKSSLKGWGKEVVK